VLHCDEKQSNTLANRDCRLFLRLILMHGWSEPEEFRVLLGSMMRSAAMKLTMLVQRLQGTTFSRHQQRYTK
jgi:hypothetical protein